MQGLFIAMRWDANSNWFQFFTKLFLISPKKVPRPGGLQEDTTLLCSAVPTLASPRAGSELAAGVQAAHLDLTTPRKRCWNRPPRTLVGLHAHSETWRGRWDDLTPLTPDHVAGDDASQPGNTAHELLFSVQGSLSQENKGGGHSSVTTCKVLTDVLI